MTKESEYTIRSRKKHPETHKRWLERNSGRMKAYQKKWWSENRGRLRGYSKKYRQNNRHKKCALEMMRQAKKKSLTVPGTEKKILEIYEFAAWLRQWFDVCVDHIIPLAHGGMHHPSNLQIIYSSENRRKGVKWLDYKPTVVFRKGVKSE